jgi:two-component system cell cycle response regulator
MSTANTKLLLQSLTDPLTGLSNRRDFDIYLGKEWHRLQRTTLPIAVIMCDLDYFKKYNDAYGHVKGDKCLQILAKILGDEIKRPADLLARYGGEEFVVVLPETNSGGAMRVAERMCHAVLAHKVVHAVSDVSPWVTISVGVACLTPDEDVHSDYLVRMADEALYKAKDQGRNQVVEWVA